MRFSPQRRKMRQTAWVRQSGRILPLSRRLDNPKALLLDTLSKHVPQRARHARVSPSIPASPAPMTSPGSRLRGADGGFPRRPPDGGLVMCHPGHVDEVLISLDPFTDQRERSISIWRATTSHACWMRTM
jgi:predicted glycoside hydrolase/deacetylase ChbG (UPF0249 family)